MEWVTYGYGDPGRSVIFLSFETIFSLLSISFSAAIYASQGLTFMKLTVTSSCKPFIRTHKNVGLYRLSGSNHHVIMLQKSISVGEFRLNYLFFARQTRQVFLCLPSLLDAQCTQVVQWREQ